MVLEMIGSPPPIEALVGLILPVVMGLVLDSIDEKGLGTVRKEWIIPRGILLNDFFPGYWSQSTFLVGERVCPFLFMFSSKQRFILASFASSLLLPAF